MLPTCSMKTVNPKKLKTGLDCRFICHFRRGLGGNIFRHCLHRKHCRHQHGRAHGTDFSISRRFVFCRASFWRRWPAMVPAYATASVLILVGASMFRSVGKISFSRIEEGLPAFLTIILIPLTFSITQGILWGFISHVGLYLIVGTAPRDSSNDVRAGVGFDWIVVAGAREVFVETWRTRG